MLSNAKKLSVAHQKSLLRDARTISTVHVAGFGTHQETEAYPCCAVTVGIPRGYELMEKPALNIGGTGQNLKDAQGQNTTASLS